MQHRFLLVVGRCQSRVFLELGNKLPPRSVARLQVEELCVGVPFLMVSGPGSQSRDCPLQPPGKRGQDTCISALSSAGAPQPRAAVYPAHITKTSHRCSAHTHQIQGNAFQTVKIFDKAALRSCKTSGTALYKWFVQPKMKSYSMLVTITMLSTYVWS